MVPSRTAEAAEWGVHPSAGRSILRASCLRDRLTDAAEMGLRPADRSTNLQSRRAIFQESLHLHAVRGKRHPMSGMESVRKRPQDTPLRRTEGTTRHGRSGVSLSGTCHHAASGTLLASCRSKSARLGHRVVLHGDNCSPLTAGSRPGLSPSHSHPRVCYDHPLSESLICTLKHHPSVPRTGLAVLAQVRARNLRLVSPAVKHRGKTPRSLPDPRTSTARQRHATRNAGMTATSATVPRSAPLPSTQFPSAPSSQSPNASLDQPA
jgi:hypothetical protein